VAGGNRGDAEDTKRFFVHSGGIKERGTGEVEFTPGEPPTKRGRRKITAEGRGNDITRSKALSQVCQKSGSGIELRPGVRGWLELTHLTA